MRRIGDRQQRFGRPRRARTIREKTVADNVAGDQPDLTRRPGPRHGRQHRGDQRLLAVAQRIAEMQLDMVARTRSRRQHQHDELGHAARLLPGLQRRAAAVALIQRRGDPDRGHPGPGQMRAKDRIGLRLHRQQIRRRPVRIGGRDADRPHVGQMGAHQHPRRRPEPGHQPGEGILKHKPAVQGVTPVGDRLDHVAARRPGHRRRMMRHSIAITSHNPSKTRRNPVPCVPTTGTGRNDRSGDNALGNSPSPTSLTQCPPVPQFSQPIAAIAR